ncbi:glycosyltransferase [Leptobacterium flavescens]|uniref:Glycosyltransferase n=2 Tax=Leptobacterium flavescens TaxID=472055 RepID=A0A6P0UFW5_9FLAO|nr:glycosyltransferase [Leptobacterium flavescens]
MDRFYIAFDRKLKEQGYTVHWFFSRYKQFEFYKELDITSGSGQVENAFLESQSDSRIKYDVVITHFVELCTPFFKEVKKRTNSHIIAVDHNPRPLHGFPIKKRLKNTLKSILYSKYIDAFIGVSAYTRKHIIKDYGFWITSKTYVVYNGIDTGLYIKNKSREEMRFIVASHLRKSKGIHDLIAAVECLSPELRDKMIIDIYGEGPEESALKKMIEDGKLEHIFNFKGSSPELPSLFASYSYLLQPTYMECFSLSILESLAANVPVITTTVGGNLEVVTHGKNGYIANPGDIKGLVSILEGIIKRELVIKENVSDLIRDQYHLDLMVDNHIKMLP